MDLYYEVAGLDACCMTEGMRKALERVCQHMHREALHDKLADAVSAGPLSRGNCLRINLVEDRDSLPLRHFQIKDSTIRE